MSTRGDPSTPDREREREAAHLGLMPQDGVHLAAHPRVRVRRACSHRRTSPAGPATWHARTLRANGSCPCVAKRLCRRTVARAEPAAAQATCRNVTGS